MKQQKKPVVLVRVGKDQHRELKKYEAASGVPVSRSVQEALDDFITCVIPARLPYFQESKANRAS